MRLNLKDAVIGKAIDALEKAQLVARRKDIVDRRKTLACLTAEGKKISRKVSKLREQFGSILSNNFSDDELNILKEMLVRVYLNIEVSLGNPRQP